MTDKTKSQTYNFLLENKTIEDIKKQENIEVKEIKNKRHGGKTYRIDNALGFEKDKSKVNSDASTSKNQSSNNKSQKMKILIFLKLLNWVVFLVIIKY